MNQQSIRHISWGVWLTSVCVCVWLCYLWWHFCPSLLLVSPVHAVGLPPREELWTDIQTETQRVTNAKICCFVCYNICILLVFTFCLKAMGKSTDLTNITSYRSLETSWLIIFLILWINKYIRQYYLTVHLSLYVLWHLAQQVHMAHNSTGFPIYCGVQLSVPVVTCNFVILFFTMTFNFLIITFITEAFLGVFVVSCSFFYYFAHLERHSRRITFLYNTIYNNITN